LRVEGEADAKHDRRDGERPSKFAVFPSPKVPDSRHARCDLREEHRAPQGSPSSAHDQDHGEGEEDVDISPERILHDERKDEHPGKSKIQEDRDVG